MYVNFIMCVPFREKATKLNNILIKSYFLEVFPCKWIFCLWKRKITDKLESDEPSFPNRQHFSPDKDSVKSIRVGRFPPKNTRNMVNTLSLSDFERRDHCRGCREGDGNKLQRSKAAARYRFNVSRRDENAKIIPQSVPRLRAARKQRCVTASCFIIPGPRYLF